MQRPSPGNAYTAEQIEASCRRIEECLADVHGTIARMKDAANAERRLARALASAERKKEALREKRIQQSQ